jgi:chromatin segregation and condensation protein Rec8/ScpA/Scc1 (kleisin family)
MREEFLEMIDVNQVIEFSQLWGSVERNGLVMEVVFTALMEMKRNPKASPLLCLQIAAKDWDC